MRVCTCVCARAREGFVPKTRSKICDETPSLRGIFSKSLEPAAAFSLQGGRNEETCGGGRGALKVEVVLLQRRNFTDTVLSETALRLTQRSGSLSCRHTHTPNTHTHSVTDLC